MSKRYWDIIRGLNGLRYYGSDETYLSLKVWLEGGRCILLKNVEIGHIFRNVAPYSVFWADSIYNKLFIADTVIPAYSHEIQAKLKKMFPSDYYLAKSIMLKNIDEVRKYRLYYETIFTRDFAYFKTINKSEKFHTTLKERLTKKVKEIASALMQTSSQSPGLMFGEMGEIVFLYEYANYIKNQNIADFANEKLNVFLQRAKTSINHYNFHHGMAGVGVALTYLNNKDYIEFDVSSYFEDIDIHIENFVLEEIKSNELGFLNHALGIEYYLSQQKSYNFSHQDLILEALQSQNKNRDGSISISNGAIGSLAFLLYIWQLGYNSIPLKKTITQLVKQIEHTEIEKQLKYDSGDLVSAYTLLRVALEFSDNNLRNRAINLILATCQRRDTIREHVFDASIIQGSSGTALIYYLSFAYTGLKVIEEALNYWTEDILDKSISDEGSAGFLPYNLNNPDCNSSLIYGSSGIGLTLISMLSGQIPEWKNWLML